MSIRENIPISRETPASSSSAVLLFPDMEPDTAIDSPRPGTAMSTYLGARTT